MPKIANKGFGLIPVLISVFALSVLSYAGYSYYSSFGKSENSLASVDKDFNSENVLQATAGGAVRDLTSFLYLSLFDSANAAEFMKGTTPILVSTSEQLDKCFFATRSSRPAVAKYTYQGKSYGARVYQNVPLQILPKNISSKKYLVVIPNTGAVIKFNDSIALIKNSCGVNVYLLEQPQTPININDFSSQVGIDDGENGSGGNTKGTSTARIEVDGRYGENELLTYTVKISPSESGTKLDPYVITNFTRVGVNVTIRNDDTKKERFINVKSMKCQGDCNNGFTFSLTVQKNESVFALKFPAPKGVRYDVVRNCYGDEDHGVNVWSNLACPIGMKN